MSLVSVIVPTFNRASLIRRCYDSVVAQAHRPLEFLLADDASTDETPAATAALPRADGVTVRLLRQPSNQGVSAARNLALRAAQGGLVALLDSDDVWFPNHLRRLLSAQQTENADLAYSRGDIRESPDAPASGRSSFGPTEYEEKHLSECLYYYNFVLPSASLMKRSFFDRVGFFDEDPRIQHAEDWDLHLRASAAGLRFAHVREPTIHYIQPPRMAHDKMLMMIRRAVHCVDKHRDYPGTTPDRRALTRSFYRLFLASLLDAKGAEAARCFREVLRLQPWNPKHVAMALLGLWGSTQAMSGESPLTKRMFNRLYRAVKTEHHLIRGISTS